MKISTAAKSAVASTLLAIFASSTASAATSCGASGSVTAAASGTGTAACDFSEFQTAVEGWLGGSLGTGLALTMLLMGGGIGVAKNSPMPALSGVAGAGFLHWGPGIVKSIMGTGALI